jgi:two-component system phosphate regulon sensor histidine kinase PhoR
MFRTFRQRIAIPYVVLILIMMIGVGIYLSVFVRKSYLQSIEVQLSSQANLLSDVLANLLSENPDLQILDNTVQTWAEQIGSRITIITPDGTVIGESQEDRTSMENHSNRPEIIAALENGFGSNTRFSRTSGYESFYLAVPVVNNGETIAVIRLARPLEQIQSSINNIQRTIIGITLLAMLIAVIIAYLIADSTTRPIRKLTDSATQLARGNLEGRLVPPTEDELGLLTQAFNMMSSRMRSKIDDLEDERRKMYTVLEEMTDGVVIVDSHGRVSMINPAAEAMFAVTQEKTLGKTLAEGFRQHLLVELWEHCKETGKLQNTLLEMTTSRLYLQCVASPLSDSLPGSILLLFQNLTRQRYLETVRRDFVSNLSHELRTPLASLKALTETLQEGALDDPPAARRFLRRIEAEVDALSQMVAELLELARIESGRVPMQMQSVAPYEIVFKAAEHLKLQADRAKLQITLRVPTDLPDILADPPRLEQVVVNLLHNAIKYTLPGGDITVSAYAATADSQTMQISSQGRVDDKPVVIFSVADTGVGIPSEDLPRIFERFYKADQARSSGGTGLGLAIAKHTIEAHGGKIWAESVEGRGSSFYFYIPLSANLPRDD